MLHSSGSKSSSPLTPLGIFADAILRPIALQRSLAAMRSASAAPGKYLFEL